MKTTTQTFPTLKSCAVCAATWMIGFSIAPAQDAQTDESEYRNWIDFSVGGSLIQGDRSGYLQRQGLPKGAFGGVTDFHYEQDVGKRGLFRLDGSGMFDNNDYSLKFSLEDPDVGFLRGGYREFRSYYDGSGGFFPPTSLWIVPRNEELHLDRGEVWFEGGLTRPGQPIITFRYSHQYRDGEKDSTIWGESNLTGGAGARGVVPSFWDIDETRDTFGMDVKHTFGKSDLGVGFRYEHGETDNARKMRRRPGEATGDRYLTHREGVESDLFNVRAFTETRFTDAILLTTGYSFTTLDTDLSGSRIYGADYDAMYDPLFARRQFRDEGFFNLSGGAQMKQYVANFNLMLTPWEHVAIIPSIRVEKQDQDGFTTFTETSVGAAPRLVTTEDIFFNTRDRGFVDVSEGLEVRYTRFQNWALYARGEWLQGEGDLQEREYRAATGALDLFRDTESSRFTQKYVIGANWYPARKLSFGAQYYHKIRSNDFDHVTDSTANGTASSDRYPAFLRNQDFTIDDANFRMTLRPLNNLTLVTRYDFQLSTIDTRGDNLNKVESAEGTAHIISQSVSWVPWSRLYLQGSISYVLDQTDTPAAAAVPGVVLDSKNDYWNANATAGFVLTDKTDLQASYFYYRADNYEDNSAFSQPYGAGTEEHGVTGGLIHRISSRLQWSIKYGFFTHSDQTSGGRNDFDAHMLFSTLRVRF